MIPVTLRELAEVVDGAVADGDPELVVSAPAFLDSRTPEPGGLFVAFAGEQADGHAYGRRGGGGRSRRRAGQRRPTGVPTVVVDDARRALQVLARVQLRRLRDDGAPAVVAVTGSQGKTSAKDLLARVLGDAQPTVATAGSFNNELGLPLTVLRATPQTRFLVLEMGARGLGHLTELCRVAPPDVSLVLNVGKAHLGEFGSRDNIARAKGEIVEALTVEGTAVLNADDPLVRGMTPSPGVGVLRFGNRPRRRRAPGGARARRARPPHLRPGARRCHRGVAMRLLGAHQATNARRRRSRRRRSRRPPGLRSPRAAGGRDALALAHGARRARRRPRACSTTPTTPTPTRCAPPSRPSPASAPLGSAHRRGAGGDA